MSKREIHYILKQQLGIHIVEVGVPYLEQDSRNLREQHPHRVRIAGCAAYIRDVGINSHSIPAHTVQSRHQSSVPHCASGDGHSVLDKFADHLKAVSEIARIFNLAGRTSHNAESLREQGASKLVFGGIERDIYQPAVRIALKTGRQGPFTLGHSDFDFDAWFTFIY